MQEQEQTNARTESERQQSHRQINRRRPMQFRYRDCHGGEQTNQTPMPAQEHQ